MLKLYAIIENGKVANIVESENEVDGVHMVELTNGFGIGDDYDGTNFIKQPQVIVKQPVFVISMRQARLQLLAQNLLEDVNLAIVTMPQTAQIEWEYATEVRRDNALVSSLKTAFSMSDSDLDLFFENANML